MKNIKRLLSVMLVVVLTVALFPVTVLAYSSADYGAIALGGTAKYDLNSSWSHNIYSFTPSTTGFYTFYSYSRSEGDPYFFLVNSANYNTVNVSLGTTGYQSASARDYYSLAYNDDSNGDGNFYVKYWCTAGTKYYCFLTKYSTARTVAYFTVRGPYYNYATLNNQSATTAGTTGYYNDTGYNGLRGWSATNSSSYFSNITIPTKTGQTFGGYYSGTNGTGTQYINASGSILNAYNGTLYAKWTANNYTLAFDKQSGSGGTSSNTLTYGSQIPASISVPIRAGYTFGGYYTATNGGGTQYYNAAGTRVYTNTWATAAGATLYAKWSNDTYTLTLNNQGVANGAAELAYNQQLPAKVTVPVRTGYSFKGYYAELNSAGTQYYDQNGNRTYNSTWTQQSGLTIYAYWQRVESTLTIDASGGTWSSSEGAGPFTKVGTTKMTIHDPAYGKKPFLGWTHSGGGSLSGNIFTFGNENATLTANWGETPTTEFRDAGSIGATASDGSASELEMVFNHIVSESDKGVTAEDLSGDNEITLSLVVDSADEYAQGASDINIEAQGQTAFFLDISVEKTVNGSNPVKLTEIPVPVEVRIPLPDDYKGKVGYSVYRYHNGVTERLSSDKDMVEHFVVEGDEIVIRTRKFSTYAVVVQEFSVSGNSYFDPIEAKVNPGWDVQALIREGGGDLYKVDISWGAMVFDYSIASSWNPETHQYDGEKIYAWLPESYFLNGNNKITAYNHSNVDVLVTFDAISTLGGVDMTVYAQNSDAENTPLAINLPLVKVPGENAPAPFVEAYLRLSGTPDDVTGNVDGAYEKAGVITVTVVAVPENGTTPVGKNP